jgi:glycosyltransferase involved in cell wall biosynthesis
MIDIVTINKDNKDGLEKTILSVINQTKFDEINYILIDGGSEDGSKDIVKKYKKYFGWSTTRKDKGIYNAMNKSLEHLKGEYVLFLNSGDYLVSNDVI